jgi:hypothetical protein
VSATSSGRNPSAASQAAACSRQRGEACPGQCHAGRHGLHDRPVEHGQVGNPLRSGQLRGAAAVAQHEPGAVHVQARPGTVHHALERSALPRARRRCRGGQRLGDRSVAVHRHGASARDARRRRRHHGRRALRVAEEALSALAPEHPAVDHLALHQ